MAQLNSNSTWKMQITRTANYVSTRPLLPIYN